MYTSSKVTIKTSISEPAHRTNMSMHSEEEAPNNKHTKGEDTPTKRSFVPRKHLTSLQTRLAIGQPLKQDRLHPQSILAVCGHLAMQPYRSSYPKVSGEYAKRSLPTEANKRLMALCLRRSSAALRTNPPQTDLTMITPRVKSAGKTAKKVFRFNATACQDISLWNARFGKNRSI